MKTLIFITVLFFLNGCSFHQEKCIEIVDENQRLLSAYSSMYVLTSFQYLTEIMNDTPPPKKRKRGQATFYSIIS